MERPPKPAYAVGQRVQLQFDGGPIGTIREVLAADTTYWYRIKLDDSRTKTPGEQWLEPAPEEAN
jgi:hypothetical protein